MKLILAFIIIFNVGIGSRAMADDGPLMLTPSEEARITSSEVKQMASQDRHFYLLTRDACQNPGAIQINRVALDTFMSTIKAGLLWDFNYIDQLTNKNSLGLTTYARDYIDSEGTKAALDECFSKDEEKISFLAGEVERNRKVLAGGAVIGVGANFLGFMLVFKILRAVIGLPKLVMKMRAFGLSNDRIRSILNVLKIPRNIPPALGFTKGAGRWKKLAVTGTVASELMLSGATEGGADSATAAYEDKTEAEKVVIEKKYCDQNLAGRENLYKDSVKFQYSKEIQGQHLSTLIGVLKRCEKSAADEAAFAILHRKYIEYMTKGLADNEN